ncbi:EsaB/YukD family protein [Paenibacillus segetis]|uniref:Ubiquitin-like domain-containing protein n=1 Tax=Paenibacillus segetis TaxID=1325360 RepID=A0ABQ1Y474_9BACL|nr:EsaB/YukD family protein [Paenibacillus segetis]GGH11022.1 hypothetical protein GCM10008013_02670 [Paenibacillus segetis]
MDYILVSFHSGSNDNIDLKVPVFVTIEELLAMLSEALNLTVSHSSKLQAEPLGRILDNSRTLEQEGVSQGALLTLV